MVWRGDHQPRAGPFTINTGGGLDLSLPGHLIPKDSLTTLKNFYYDGYSILPRTRKGLGDGHLTSAKSYAINGIFYYVKDADTAFMVFSFNGELHYLNGAVSVKIGNLPNTDPPQFTNINGVLLIACGDGEPFYVWDGTTTVGTPVKASATVTFPTTASSTYSTGTLTMSGTPANGATFTLTREDGTTEVYTLATARGKPFQVTNSATPATLAANIETAIDADSELVSADAVGAVVTLTNLISGDGGDTISMAGSTGDFTVDAATLGAGGGTQGKGGVSAGEYLTIGSQAYQFAHGRGQKGEVTIGATPQDTAANLVAAIATDQWDVAVKTDNSASDPPVIVVESTAPGAAGNALVLTKTALNITISGATFSGGVDRMGLYTIETAEAPTPDIIHNFMGRIWTAQAGSDEVRISSPFSHMDWSATYGFGEYETIGLRDGNEIVAIGHFKNEVVIHKAGRNPEIYRLVIGSPIPSTWSLDQKFYENVRVAKTAKCVASVADKHFYYSNKTLEALTGSEAYDEMRGEGPGYKVQAISQPTSAAFMLTHPDSKNFLICPTGEADLLCYNYVQDKWSTWQWSGIETVSGCYNESENVLYWGGADGQIYSQEAQVFDDAGESYTSHIITAVFGADDLQDHYIKQTIFDYKGLDTGQGSVYALVGKESQERQKIADFTTGGGSPFIFDSRGYIYDASDYIFVDDPFQRVNVGQVAGGRDFAIEIELEGGGLEVVTLTFMIALVGRDLK